jgi:cytochrome P450
VLRVFNGNMAEDLPVIMQAQDELDEYVRDLVSVRRAQPGEDLLTDLIAAEEAGDRLSTDELVMLAEAVLVAGTDTTRNQLALAVAVFTGHPDQWALLAEQPSLAPRAVEESMRVLGAVRNTGRIVTEDVVYRDVLFPAGTLVFPGLAAGNLDPETFTEPNRFDITRQGGAAQLTFGSGIHVCLGAALARAELQEALPLLARRMPGLRLDGEIAWKPNPVGIWGPERLPIAFEAGH